MSWQKETNQPITQSQDTVNVSTSNRLTHENNNAQTSAIVPVYVSTQREPSKEVPFYAMRDTQSFSSFILNKVADNLDTTKTQVKLKLSTMSSKKTTVPCIKLEALHIRGLFSKKKLPVPVVYTRDFIPVNRSHIPTPDTARAWPHLKHLAKHTAPPLDCTSFNAQMWRGKPTICPENRFRVEQNKLLWFMWNSQWCDWSKSLHHCKTSNTRDWANHKTKEWSSLHLQDTDKRSNFSRCNQSSGNRLYRERIVGETCLTRRPLLPYKATRRNQTKAGRTLWNATAFQRWKTKNSQ